MKTLAECKSGEIIRWSGYEWIVIEGHDENNKVLLMKNILECKAFDDNKNSSKNNWMECNLRTYLNKDFYKKLNNKEDILFYTSDLKADNGDDNYGKCTDKVFLISMGFYRYHRKDIALADRWWWTITPSSLNANYMRCVGGNGTVLDYTANSCAIGVRPACLVKSSIQIESNNESDKKEKLKDLSENEQLIYQRGEKDTLYKIIQYCAELIEKMEEE